MLVLAFFHVQARRAASMVVGSNSAFTAELAHRRMFFHISITADWNWSRWISVTAPRWRQSQMFVGFLSSVKRGIGHVKLKKRWDVVPPMLGSSPSMFLFMFIPQIVEQTVPNQRMWRGFHTSFLLSKVRGLIFGWWRACDGGHRKQRAAGFPPSFTLVQYPSPHLGHFFPAAIWSKGKVRLIFPDPRARMSRVFIWSVSAGHKGSSVYPRTCVWSCVCVSLHLKNNPPRPAVVT